MSLFSLAVLPFSLVRHPLRPLSNHLRRTALRTLAFGPALGAAYALVRINSIQTEAGIEASARSMRADQGERKREDYATIGAVIGAVSLPPPPPPPRLSLPLHSCPAPLRAGATR